MFRFFATCSISACFLLSISSAATIAEKTADATRLPGYFSLFWDAKTGKLWMEIDKWDTELLYVTSLPAGVGSNDIGLDRGTPGETRIVKFMRSGPNVLMLQPNYAFRASSDNPFERRAVEESFAQSVIWGFAIEAEDGSRVLVDATAFFLRDAAGVINALHQSQQGTYHVEASRSAIYLDRTRSFPKNTEVEALLTFLGDTPGPLVREVAPDPGAITVREHHSFVELPGPGYRPRVFDPRAGYFDLDFMDFAKPIAEPITTRYIVRHRLAKKDSSAAVSEAVKPIVYYLDRGAPEPIQSALLEGARWWNQAFEAAGYKNAFRVELLPEDADPMDIRYNLIQWVHRSTRGWSYGAAVADPRTGEIIRGKVTLGSLRVRQDFLIAEGLLAPYETGKPANPEMERMALSRLRQLAAHEVGHTLGLAHNFAASSRGRASVMDYPGPYATLDQRDGIDLSEAYATGIADWDKVAIAYGYQDFPSGTNEAERLKSILNAAHAKGLYFISDSDSRPEGGAHPSSHLWDNGSNAVDELNRIMKLRAVALGRFSERNIREDAPWSSLEEVLVPLYLGHRYQVAAAAKVLGGLDYRYALRGDGQTIAEIVPGTEQRRALKALLATVNTDALAIPERVLKQIPPRPIGYPRTRESFLFHTGLTFDPLAAAESAANLTLGLILHPERAARLVQYHARDHKAPGLDEVIDAVLAATWHKTPTSGFSGEVQRAVDYVALYHLTALAANEGVAPQARAIALMKTMLLHDWLKTAPVSGEEQKAQNVYAIALIDRLLNRPKEFSMPKPQDAPPGQPIGCDWDARASN